jgi:integrase/recombinase XerC
MIPTASLVRGRNARNSLPAPLTIAAGRKHTAATILQAWRAGKSENTLRSYEHDLLDFAQYFANALRLELAFSHRERIERALTFLFRQSSPSAHEIALGFRHYMESAGLAPSSINRHLACLRSVTRLGRQLGMMTWYLEVSGVKAEARRDTAGPTIAEVRQMLAATSGESEGEARDYAIIVTFVSLGLRVSELCNLDMQDIDIERRTAWIHGKGRRERELVPLPQPVVDAIRRYSVYRGVTRGPVFRTRGNRGVHLVGRLGPKSVGRIVRILGARVGLHVWPHALRHTAISQALEHAAAAGIGFEKVRWYSRHKSIATLLLYQDHHDHTKTHRTLADLVAASLD